MNDQEIKLSTGKCWLCHYDLLESMDDPSCECRNTPKGSRELMLKAMADVGKKMKEYNKK